MSQEKDSEPREIAVNHDSEQKIPNQISREVEKSRNEQPIQIHSQSQSERGGIAQNKNQNDENEQKESNLIQDKKDGIQSEEQEENEEEPAQPNEEELGRENEEGGKNVRKNSSESIRESRENETSQLQVAGGGKKCFNKQCPSKKIFKKIRSKVESNKYRFLCKNCYENYSNNYFCQFCEQIYSNNQDHDEEDMNRWVGCDTCDRWNHIQCQKKYRNKFFDIEKQAKYECLVCARKSKNLINPVQEVPKKKVQREYDANVGRNQRMKIEINKEQRVSIFHKKPETYPNLQPFLQGYNFRLWLTEAMIRDDIEALRSSLRRPPIEDEPKKIKKIKQD